VFVVQTFCVVADNKRRIDSAGNVGSGEHPGSGINAGNCREFRSGACGLCRRLV